MKNWDENLTDTKFSVSWKICDLTVIKDNWKLNISIISPSTFNEYQYIEILEGVFRANQSTKIEILIYDDLKHKVKNFQKNKLPKFTSQYNELYEIGKSQIFDSNEMKVEILAKILKVFLLEKQTTYFNSIEKSKSKEPKVVIDNYIFINVFSYLEVLGLLHFYFISVTEITTIYSLHIFWIFEYFWIMYRNWSTISIIIIYIVQAHES